MRPPQAITLNDLENSWPAPAQRKKVWRRRSYGLFRKGTMGPGQRHPRGLFHPVRSTRPGGAKRPDLHSVKWRGMEARVGVDGRTKIGGDDPASISRFHAQGQLKFFCGPGWEGEGGRLRAARSLPIGWPAPVCMHFVRLPYATGLRQEGAILAASDWSGKNRRSTRVL